MAGQTRANTNHASFNRSYTYEDLESQGNFTSGTLPFEDIDEVRQRKEAEEKILEETDPENFERFGTPEYTGYYKEEDTEYERYPVEREDKQTQIADHTGKGPKGWRRSDAAIYEDANEALFRSYEVDASDIDVSVRDGILTLTGFVDSRTSKREAESCIEHIHGIKDVKNNLQIRD